MFDDLFYPTDRKGLWTKEMILLSLSNLLLYISLYIFLSSLPFWINGKFGCGLAVSALVVASFAIAMFIPGPFNNYILDKFKRKKVGFWTFVLLGIVSCAYFWSFTLWMILFIRVVQGILFSVITTTTSSTLVIDVTPTKKRTLANLTYARVGRVGMTIGVLLGLYLSDHYGMDYIFYASAIMAILSGFIILFIRVPFRAPLKPALCSLDRFLLPRALPVVINMIFTPIIFGLLVSYVSKEVLFIELAIGSVCGYILMNMIFKNLDSKVEVELSSLSVVCGYILLAITNNFWAVSFGFVLLGLGLGILSNRFYVMTISIPLHCERGSANNTFSLIWEVGIFTGLLLGYLFDMHTSCIRYLLPILFMLTSLLIYELFTHKWYYRQMEK